MESADHSTTTTTGSSSAQRVRGTGDSREAAQGLTVNSVLSESSNLSSASVLTFLPSRPVRFKRKNSLVATGWGKEFNELLKKTDQGHTHQCMICAWTVKLPQTKKGSFVNNKAVRHLLNEHKIGVDQAKRKKMKKLLTTSLSIHAALKNADMQQHNLEDAFQKVLVDQGHWFLFAKTRVPSSAFFDARFRQMATSLIDFGRAGGTSTGLGSRKPWQSSQKIGSFVDSAFLTFTGYLRLFLQEIREKCKGNLFAQGMHDGVTLDNKEKFLLIGLQVPDPQATRNWVICIGFKHAPLGTAAPVAKSILENEFLQLTGMKYTDVASGTVSDRAALKHFRICGLAAASFCERVNSQANHIVRKDNTRLKSETIEKAVMMRMNAELFEQLKQKYSTVPIEQVLEVAQSRSPAS